MWAGEVFPDAHNHRRCGMTVGSPGGRSTIWAFLSTPVRGTTMLASYPKAFRVQSNHSRCQHRAQALPGPIVNSSQCGG